MMGNQYKFEVIRDLITIISKLENGKHVEIMVKRLPEIGSVLFDWTTSMGECYGYSEVANAIKEAHENAMKGVLVPNKSCENCIFQQRMRCHLNPPLIVDGGDEYAITSQHPDVKNQDWCSHWEKQNG